MVYNEQYNYMPNSLRCINVTFFSLNKVKLPRKMLDTY